MLRDTFLGETVLMAEFDGTGGVIKEEIQLVGREGAML
jgi:hypothetical protein